jgi:hypothetical protein
MDINTSLNPPIGVITDVTTSRAIDGTVYTNTTGKTMFVMVAALCTVTVAAGMAFIRPIVAGFSMSASGLVSAPIMSIEAEITFAVPPGATYSVATYATNGNCIKDKWVESY